MQDRDSIKEQIAAIYKKLLGASGQLDQDVSFISLGGQSIQAAKLQIEIIKTWGIKLNFKELFKNSSVNELADLIYERTKKGEEPVIASAFPVTDLQRAYINGSKKDAPLGGLSTRAYFECKCKDYDRAAFEKAVNKLIEHHETLRTRFAGDGMQQVIEKCTYKVKENDFRKAGNIEKAIEERRKALFIEDFDDAKAPLIKFEACLTGDEEALIMCCYDGKIGDGWSQGIIIRDLERLLKGERLEPIEIFEDYVSFLNDMKELPQYEEDKAYWEEITDKVPFRPELPLKGKPESISEVAKKQITKVIEKEQWGRFSAEMRENGITPFAGMLTLFGKALAKYSESKDFFINVPVSMRTGEKNRDNCIGLYSNFMFFDYEDNRKEALIEQMDNNQEKIFDRRSHLTFQGTDTLKLFQKRTGGKTAGPVVFTSILEAPDEDGEILTKAYTRSHSSQIWFETVVSKCGKDVMITVDYADALFESYVAQGIADTFADSIVMVGEKDIDITRDSAIGLCRRDRQIIRSAESVTEKIDGETLGGLLEKSFKANGERLALADQEESLTYSRLEGRISALGAWIRSKAAIKEGSTVAVLLNKGKNQIISALTCISNKWTYMPLESEIAEQQLKECLVKSDADIIITSDEFIEITLNAESVDVINIDVFEEEFRYDDTAASVDFCKSFGEQPPVIIHTSGTTGVPKGISLPEDGIVNCIICTNKLFEISNEDRILALTNACHDMSLYDTFGIFAAGGASIVPSYPKNREPRAWIELMKKYGVTLWNSVPAFMEMLLIDGSEERKACLKNLKCVWLGGDWIKVDVAERLIKECTNGAVYSVGGPTETTIWNICHRINHEDIKGSYIPYGKPLPNVVYHILDENLEECPVGIPGVMYVTGKGVANGYVGMTDEAEGKFVIYKGEKACNTGDIGIYLPDGDIRILGRKDNQVKINGKRIELNGIESRIGQYDEIESNVVVYNEKIKQICCFYTAERAIDEKDIKEYLKKYLPDYMIPSRYIMEEGFPVTDNGKVDRKSLAQQDIPGEEEKKDEEDSDGIETALLNVCRGVLEDDGIQADEDFFAMGGDSIAAMKIVAWVSQKYQVELEVFDILGTPTIKDWAAIIAERKA